VRTSYGANSRGSWKRPARCGERSDRSSVRLLEPEILAQRGAGIVAVEHPAPLQQWHDLLDEIPQSRGQHVDHEIEAVSCAFAMPGLDELHDLLWCADDLLVPAAVLIEHLAYREPFLLGEPHGGV